MKQINIHQKLIIVILIAIILSIFYRNFFLDAVVLSYQNFKIFYLIEFFLYFSFIFFLYMYFYLRYIRHSNFFKFETSTLLLLTITLIIIFLLKFLISDFINKYTLFGLNEHRATHWLVTYQDFGFIKRSFMGSAYKYLFSTLPSFRGIIIISIIFLILTVILILYLVINVFRKYSNSILFMSVALFITSPYFIYFYLADLGRFDQFNNFIMVFCLFLVPKFYILKNTLLISFLICSAILIHESFILLQLPFIFFLVLLEVLLKFKEHRSQIIKSLILLLLSLFFTISLVAVFGFPNHITVNDMVYIIGEVKSFELRKDVLDTYFYIPWENLNIFDRLISSFKISESFSNVYLLIDFFLINFPFLVANIYLLMYIKDKISFSFFKINNLLYLIIIFPFVFSLMVTFNDHYRIFASITLILFLSNIYLLYNNQISLENLKLSNSKILMVIGVFYNFFIIGITTITAYSSSSPSIYLFLMDKLFFG